jgi:hypothetical protein
MCIRQCPARCINQTRRLRLLLSFAFPTLQMPGDRQVFTGHGNTYNFVAQDQTNTSNHTSMHIGEDVDPHPQSHLHGVTSRPTPALNAPRSSGGHVVDTTRSSCVLLGRKSSSRLRPNVLSASMPDYSRCFRFWPSVYAIPIARDFHLVISSHSLQLFGPSKHPSTIDNVHW